MADQQVLPEINLDELRREVQRRHLIPISEKDPVLAVASMIDLVTEQSCKRFLAALDQALVKQQRASIRIGENIVQQGADHMVAATQACIRDVLKNGVEEIASRTSDAAELLQQILNEQEAILARTKIAGTFSIIGAVLFGLAGVVSVGVFLGHLIAG